MTPNQVIKYYGTIAEAARETGFTRAAFHKWIKQQYIPLSSQWNIKEKQISNYYLKTPLKIGKPYCKEDLK